MLFTIRRRSQVSLFQARVGRTCTLDRQPPNKSATTSSIDLFRYLSLRLLFEDEDLFHFYVSLVWRLAFHFEGAYFRQLRGSLFGGFKSGRRGLLDRAKRPFPRPFFGWKTCCEL